MRCGAEATCVYLRLSIENLREVALPLSARSDDRADELLRAQENPRAGRRVGAGQAWLVAPAEADVGHQRSRGTGTGAAVVTQRNNRGGTASLVPR